MARWLGIVALQGPFRAKLFDGPITIGFLTVLIPTAVVLRGSPDAHRSQSH